MNWRPHGYSIATAMFSQMIIGLAAIILLTGAFRICVAIWDGIRAPKNMNDPWYNKSLRCSGTYYGDTPRPKKKH